MSESLVRVRQEGAVAQVRLMRPQVRNALDDATAARLGEVFEALVQEWSLRAVVLSGEGSVFCAGGDLAWMRRAAAYTHDQNLADAEAFQRAFEAIDRFPRPVIARVQGAALGGGAGLIAACDLVVASSEAVFGFPEVRLGLVPGVISPYVIARIGAGAARRWFVTGERFDAAEAQRMGLVDVVVPAEGLDAEVQRVLGEILKGSPEGQGRAKALVREVAGAPSPESARAIARRSIADARASKDGREGTSAFLEKRKPEWLT